MPDRNGPGATAPPVVERFVKQLNITYKAVKLYPLSSAIPRDNGRAALEVLHRILRDVPEVRLDVTKDGLIYETLAVFPGHPAFTAFAREFYNRNIADVRFRSSATVDEILRFLSVLDVPVTDLESSGGFETRLWDLGVNNISVTYVSTRVVEAEVEETSAESWPPSSSTIDDILAESLGRRPRSQRLLTRLIADPLALSSYIGAVGEDVGVSPTALVAHRIVGLARAAQQERPEDRGAMYAALAGALRELDRALLHDVLVRLLGDARQDETVAGVVRAMALEDVCAALLTEQSYAPGEVGELARTVRNLVALGLAPRNETLGAVEDALASSGAPEEFIAGLREEVAPSRLRVRERPPTEEKPADVVLRLLDVAATNLAVTASERPELEGLAEEAAYGITDADVFGALVTLITLEHRPEQFASVMSLLENNLGLLLERHDFGVAADAAEALVQTGRRDDLPDTHRQRVMAALEQLALPAHMRIVASAMHVYSADSDEHHACVRLLSVLGSATLSPLLEVLAAEKDMASRKQLVDIISGLADRFIPELGERVTDNRWYFVRNIVSILGATRSADALPYLERTLRYPDPRVRRETLRSIAGISDAFASEMLVAGLRDEDAGNVQIAARYLGAARFRRAVPALEEVARGEGRGNRDAETRIDAIEALGRIAEPSSLAVLDTIARQRSIRASRNRELRSAARAAAAAIRAKGGAR